jgi:hypothetical protein
VTIVLVHAAATWFMAGAIVFVQAVHYPLFPFADPSRFRAFAAEYGRRTAIAVVPAMGVEAACAAWLAYRVPRGIPPEWTVIGAALVAVIWLSTALLQAPQHARLASGFDANAHRALVATNWVRTGAWVARAFLAAAMLERASSTP